MLALAVAANAQNYTWTGTTASQSWDNSAFWSPTGPPVSTGSIVNPVATGTAAIQIDSGTRTIANITLSSAMTVIGASTSGTSSQLVLTGSLTKSGANTVSFRDSTGPLGVEIQNGINISGGTLRFGTSSVTLSGLTVSGTTTMAGSGATTLGINMVNGGTANFGSVNFTGASNFNIRDTAVSGTSAVRVTSLSGNTGSVQNNGTTGGGGADSLGILIVDTVSTSTFGGVIRNNNNAAANTLALVKSGVGMQVLTNANTYTGGTTVTAGTLVLTGTGSIGTGGLAVGQGGIFDISGLTAGTYTHGAALSGGGTINATGKTFIANGTVNPGDGIGQLSVTGNLTLGSSAATTLAINGTTGGSFDSIAATGALSYGGALSLSFGSLFTSGIVDLNLIDFSSFSGAFSSVTLTGAYAGGLSLAGNLWSGEVGGQTFTFDQATGLLNTTAVPEPGTMALLGLGLAAVLWRSRKRA